MSVECGCGVEYATDEEAERCLDNQHGWTMPDGFWDVHAAAREAFEHEHLQGHLAKKNPNADYLGLTEYGGYDQPHIQKQWCLFLKAYLLANGWKPPHRVKITGDTSKIPTKAP